VKKKIVRGRFAPKENRRNNMLLKDSEAKLDHLVSTQKIKGGTCL